MAKWWLRLDFGWNLFPLFVNSVHAKILVLGAMIALNVTTRVLVVMGSRRCGVAGERT